MENYVAASCKIHGDIYISNTGEELWERFRKHRYDAKNRPDNNELTVHIHTYKCDFEKDIEVSLLKGNLYQKQEKELWQDKFTYLLDAKVPTGLTVD